MIVVDGSAWIALLRGIDNAAVFKLRELAGRDNGQVLVGDLIMVEVLQGARDDAHAVRIERDPRRFTVARMPDDSVAIQAAGNYRRLRARGITVRKTIALVIGTFCMAEGHRLLHDDRDFDATAQYLGLEVH